MSQIIRIENIRKTFGDHIGVDNISLNVEKGEFITLLGPSGCGKSTLLRMIAGFENPTSGSIWLDGENVTELPPNRRAINMVFQDYALFPHMTVGQNIGYGLKVQGINKSDIAQKVKDVLKLVDLSDKIDVYPQQLSGGQRQRIALARAIVRNPKVLLLDEPLSALDANLREQMQVELKSLHDRLGLTFIMVTHDQTEALVMSDRIVVMRSGNIVQAGDPLSLYNRPANAYVADFIGTMNLFPSEIFQQDNKLSASLYGQSITLSDNLKNTTGGQQMLLGFRPEHARIVLPGSEGSDAALSGRVENYLYHGSTIRTVVRIGEGTVLIDSLASDGDSPAFIAGQEVMVSINPDKVLPFNMEAAS